MFQFFSFTIASFICPAALGNLLKGRRNTSTTSSFLFVLISSKSMILKDLPIIIAIMFYRRLRIFKIPYLSPKDFRIRFVAVPSAGIFYNIVSFK
ncbi:hypothetical protein FC692_21800 [Bacillus cereus]|nr:hypothetical protein FC692_21800 [Bacillus cereus]